MLMLLLIALINSSLGILIFLRSPRQTTNRLFFLLVLFAVLWMISSYFTDTAPLAYRLFWGEVAFVFPILATTSLALLSTVFPKATKVTTKEYFCLGLATSAGIVFSLTGLVVNQATARSSGTDLNPGPLYYMYIVIIVSIFLYALFKHFKMRHSYNKQQRQQSQLIIIGFMLSFFWILFMNVILPIVASSWQTTKLGPLGTVIFVVFTGYAIIRHHMFNIKRLILRFGAYIISLIIVSILFSTLAFSLPGLIFQVVAIPSEVQIFYIVIAIGVAMCFGPLRKLVSLGTNRLFFQEAYSAQEVLSKIGTYTTRNVNIHKMQQYTVDVLQSTLKPEYAGFLIFKNSGKLKTGVHSEQYPLKELDSNGAFVTKITSIHSKVTFVDDLENGSKAKDFFISHGVGAVVRLSSSNKSTGYLLLGDKMNGSSYDETDYNFLSLMSNDLALALQNAQRYEEIQLFNETLQAKVSAATQALKKTNQKLVALDDAKDEFISMASHQLRTPLTSVKGYISMMLEEDLGKINTTQKQALKEAFDSSQRMVFLISDFLNVSRIRTGKFIIEKSSTNLVQIVQEEITQLREMAQLRGQVMHYTPPEAFPIVMLDENKIRQVMMNMIDNAIYYTPPEGDIHVFLEKNDNEILFKVVDSGIGVPKSDQHRLFTKFFRASNARKARPDGTGLGLFMAQKIITAQNGNIIFQSEEGKGSTFGFRFPLDKVKQ